MNNTYFPKYLLNAILCITAGILVAPDASAMINREADNAVKVTFADLDLSRQEGVQALYKRLEIAAKQVCGTHDLRILGMYRQIKQCRESALNEAVERIDNHQLNDLHSK